MLDGLASRLLGHTNLVILSCVNIISAVASGMASSRRGRSDCTTGAGPPDAGASLKTILKRK